MPGAAPLQVEFLEPVAERPALERQATPPTVALPRGQHGARVALERRARDERRRDPCALALLLPIDVEAQVIRLEAGAPDAGPFGDAIGVGIAGPARVGE